MSMTNQEIKQAVDGIMALRPDPFNQMADQDKSRAEIKRRRDELEFKREMAGIEAGEITSQPAHYFHNENAAKGGKKFDAFNPYAGGGN